MRRLFAVSLVLTFLLIFSTSQAQVQTCRTIQDGVLQASDGSLLQTGFDQWGFNYQAHEFNGKYCDAYRGADWCQQWANDDLTMKWNEAWMSNRDCDGDGLLDRADDNGGTYRGTGAWTTNHQKGVYLENGKKQRWEYFVKIVAAPLDAELVGGTWKTADGSELGASIWNDFAVVQEVFTDTGTGDHGVLYLSPYTAGFGRFSPTR